MAQLPTATPQQCESNQCDCGPVQISDVDRRQFFVGAATEGCGLYKRTIDGNQMKASIRLSEGLLRVGQITLELPAGKTDASAMVRIGGNQVAWKFESQGNKAILQFWSPMILREDDQINIKIEVS